MKNTKKITLSAILSALAAVVMLVSYFPYFTYAVPAIAGLLVMVAVIEIGCKWAFPTYFSSAFLAFLFGETESKLIYICFFGFYPIIKCLIEKFRKPAIEWILKLTVFNFCVISLYYIFAEVLMLSFEDMGKLAEYGAVILLILGNIVFVVYDIAVSRLAVTYIDRIHPKLEKLLK